MASKPVRYFLAQDNASHWYLIPACYRAKWEAFCEADPSDQDFWDCPAYAVRLKGGGPESVTFKEPTGF